MVQITGMGVTRAWIRGDIRPDGSFSIEHVTPGKGKAVLMAGRGGRYVNTVSQDIDVRDGQTTTVDLTLTDVRVSGRVTRGGKPVADYRVSFGGGVMMITSVGGMLAPPPSAGLERLSGLTDADGRYELLVGAPGKYSISVSSQGREKTAIQRLAEVSVPDAETFTHDVVVPDWSLTGVVVDKETKQPLADAKVDVRPAGNVPGGAGLVTGLDGRYQIAVESGSYRVSASAPKYVAQNDTMTLGGAAVERTFELVRGGSVKGHVLTPGGLGADMAQVFALPTDGPSARTARALVDGSFVLDGLTAGSYQVFAAHALGFALQPVLSFDQPVELTLKPGTKTRLRFKDEKGVLLKDTSVSVELIRVDGTRVGIEQNGSYSSGRRLEGDPFAEMVLPNGTVDMVAWVADKKLRGEAHFTVPSTDDVVITLKPAR
jgi:hypothetical protein